MPCVSVHDARHPTLGGRHGKKLPPLPAFQSLPADADDTDALEETFVQEGAAEIRIYYASEWTEPYAMACRNYGISSIF